jgi:Bacterial type II and III secretion system protein.
LVANGETIILGGLIKEVERTLKNRVPGLSYIPFSEICLLRRKSSGKNWI